MADQPDLSGLSATALLAALRSVPPELPPGQYPLWVDGSWRPVEVPPGCRLAMRGGLVVIEGELSAEQWEAQAAEVQERTAAEFARRMRELGVSSQPASPPEPAASSARPRSSRRPEGSPPDQDGIRVVPADDIPKRERGWRRGVLRVKRS